VLLEELAEGPTLLRRPPGGLGDIAAGLFHQPCEIRPLEGGDGARLAGCRT
jgi:hypothetical protein